MARKKKSKRNETQPRRRVKSLASIDFSYLVEMDYDTYNACEHGSDCCQNDYCRCGVLTNIHATSVNIPSIVRSLLPCSAPKIHRYAVDRILRIYEVYNPGLYEGSAVGGYYGEELGPVTICHQVAQKCDKAIGLVMNIKQIKEIVEYLLTLEYGFLLPVVRDKTWSFRKIDPKSLVLGQQDHYRKVSRNSLDLYQDWDLPVAVCVRLPDGKYRIILTGLCSCGILVSTGVWTNVIKGEHEMRIVLCLLVIAAIAAVVFGGPVYDKVKDWEPLSKAMTFVTSKSNPLVLTVGLAALSLALIGNGIARKSMATVFAGLTTLSGGYYAAAKSELIRWSWINQEYVLFATAIFLGLCFLSSILAIVIRIIVGPPEPDFCR